MKILLLKFLLKTNSKWGIYNPVEICPLAAEKGQIALPVDRPVDRPTVTFLTVEPNGRSPGRPSPDPESNSSLADRPPGRPELDTESRLSVRSTARSTGGFSREQSSLAVDRPSQPASPAWLRARSVHVGRPARSTAHCYGRPVRSTGSQPVQLNQVLKLGFLLSIKSHKFHKNQFMLYF